MMQRKEDCKKDDLEQCSESQAHAKVKVSPDQLLEKSEAKSSTTTAYSLSTSAISKQFNSMSLTGANSEKFVLPVLNCSTVSVTTSEVPEYQTPLYQTWEERFNILQQSDEEYREEQWDQEDRQQHQQVRSECINQFIWCNSDPYMPESQ